MNAPLEGPGHAPTGRRWALLLVLAWPVGESRAHDAFEITTDARLGESSLELRVTMARSTALAVAHGVREAPTFDPEKFAGYAARFSAAAPRLYAIRGGDGALLELRQSSVALGREADVEFRLTYARPAPGPLRFEAKQLALLGAGYGDVFALHDARGALLAQELLGVERSAIVVPLAAEPERGARRSASAVAALTLTLGLCWLMRRRFSESCAA